MDLSNQLGGMRLLVADDENFSLTIVGRMLRELGCADVVTADSGARALGQFSYGQLDRVDLMILDFNMPDINGLQILKLIRSGKAGAPSDLPVVMLTGTADGGLVAAAVALDVGAFVVKPVSKATLAGRLTKVLSEQRAFKTAAQYEAIDIDSVSKALLTSHRPVGGAKAARPDRVDVPNAVKLRLESVPVGAVLAEDIRGPDGELLLGRGTPLSDRFLRRLRDLSGVARIDYLFVQQSKKNGFS